MLISLLWNGIKEPGLLSQGAEFSEYSAQYVRDYPILPMLFVTIACGIISGFHATQAPIISRTMKSEKEAKSNFYGMMVVEGIIAMIWAGGGLAIYNKFPDLLNANTTYVLSRITDTFLGSVVGTLTIFAVIVLAITSGDTAMRSLRLSLAEAIKVPQTQLKNRVVLCIPLMLIITLLLWWSNQDVQSFNYLWNYFSWGNQVLAVSTLMAAAVWLMARKKNFLPALVPGMFMSFIVITYIVWISPAHKGPVGLGLPLYLAYTVAVVVTILIGFLVCRNGKKMQQENQEN